MAIQLPTDEELALILESDYPLIVPKSGRRAWGTDGATSVDGWTFTSPSNNFIAQGVLPSYVIRLPERGGKLTIGKTAGVLYAVDSVVGPTQLRLRPLGGASGTGWPPQPANTSGLEFAVDSVAGKLPQAIRDIEAMIASLPGLVTINQPGVPIVYPLYLPTDDTRRTLYAWQMAANEFADPWRNADVNADTWQAKMKYYAGRIMDWREMFAKWLLYNGRLSTGTIRINTGMPITLPEF